jgi:NDP-sugar pyrophosphorylase family protein
MMKAVILAAGQGSRISSLTRKIPKPMIKYNGKPILEHNIELCKKNGITEIFINTHHLADIIKNYFGNGNRWGVNIHYSYEKELLGTASALTNFKDDLKDDSFFLIYGDNYSNFDILTLKAKAETVENMAVIGFHYREDVSTSGVAEFDNNGKILKFIEKPKPGETSSHWVNAGIYYLAPSIFDAIPNKFSDFGRDIFPMLLRNNIPFYGVCLDSLVLAFDTPEMLKDNLID